MHYADRPSAGEARVTPGSGSVVRDEAPAQQDGGLVGEREALGQTHCAWSTGVPLTLMCTSRQAVLALAGMANAPAVPRSKAAMAMTRFKG